MGGGVEIDDRGALHAARDMMADADDARLVLDPGDKAAGLGRADVERGDRRTARPRRRAAVFHALLPDGRAAFTGGSGGGGPAPRTTSRSGRRRSTVRMSRFRRLLERSSAASRVHASPG